MRKVTEEHLAQIQNNRQSLAEIVSSIGELTLNRFLLNKQLGEINSLIEVQQQKFIEFQEKEKVLYDTLQQTYGTGTINIETGEVVD